MILKFNKLTQATTGQVYLGNHYQLLHLRNSYASTKTNKKNIYIFIKICYCIVFFFYCQFIIHLEKKSEKLNMLGAKFKFKTFKHNAKTLITIDSPCW